MHAGAVPSAVPSPLTGRDGGVPARGRVAGAVGQDSERQRLLTNRCYRPVIDAVDSRYLDNRTVTANADAESFAAACRALLPDATVIVHGSLALGDFRQGESDLDLLVLSNASTHGLAEALEEEWSRDPVKFDLRVVSYAAAAQPTKRPRVRLCVDGHGASGLEVEEDKLEPDLLIDFSVCRQIGEGKLIGAVPPESVERWGDSD